MTVDTAISHILSMGPGVLLEKFDIKHAFHLLPVHPAYNHLLTMCWKDDLFIDTCLLFGPQTIQYSGRHVVLDS